MNTTNARQVVKPIDVNNLDSAIERHWSEYIAQITLIAQQVFDNHICPFCDEAGVNFIASEGQWWVGNANGPFDFETQGHQHIADMLVTPVNGLDGDLGSLMPNYQRKSDTKP